MRLIRALARNVRAILSVNPTLPLDPRFAWIAGVCAAAGLAVAAYLSARTP